MEEHGEKHLEEFGTAQGESEGYKSLSMAPRTEWLWKVTSMAKTAITDRAILPQQLLTGSGKTAVVLKLEPLYMGTGF